MLSVQRIKSPLHHFNACSPKDCSWQDLHLHSLRSRHSASASWATRANDIAPVAGLAPARIRLKDEMLDSLHSRANSSRQDSHPDCARISDSTGINRLCCFTPREERNRTRGRSCTCTVPILKRTSLLLDYAGICSQSDSHRYCADLKSAASALGYRSESNPRGRTCTYTFSGLSGVPLHWATRGRKLALPAGISPATSAFEPRHSRH